MLVVQLQLKLKLSAGGGSSCWARGLQRRSAGGGGQRAAALEHGAAGLAQGQMHGLQGVAGCCGTRGRQGGSAGDRPLLRAKSGADIQRALFARHEGLIMIFFEQKKKKEKRKKKEKQTQKLSVDDSKHGMSISILSAIISVLSLFFSFFFPFFFFFFILLQFKVNHWTAAFATKNNRLTSLANNNRAVFHCAPCGL